MRDEANQGGKQGRGWFLTWLRGVEVVFMDEQLTRESFDDYLKVVENQMKTANTRRPILYEVRDTKVIDAQARGKLTQLMNRYPESVRKFTHSFALVTPSATVRGILTAIYWFSPPPYPNKVFAAVHDACVWLADQSPSLDAAALEAEYEAFKRKMTQRAGAA